MADQQQQIPNAPFPAPPPFWKQFTSENLSRLKALKDQGKKPEDIPLELTYLEPPPPPAQTYTIFGEEQTLSTELPTLSSLGITQLYPSPSSSQSQPLHHPYYLLLIIRSLHLNFTELTNILSQNPTLKQHKLEDIKNLFQNAHWLINMYRPHQARESLIAMMEEQLEEGRREMEECDVVKRKVERVLREIEDGKFHGGRGDSGQDMGAKAQGEELHVKQLWKMMTDIDAGMD